MSFAYFRFRVSRELADWDGKKWNLTSYCLAHYIRPTQCTLIILELNYCLDLSTAMLCHDTLVQFLQFIFFHLDILRKYIEMFVTGWSLLSLTVDNDEGINYAKSLLILLRWKGIWHFFFILFYFISNNSNSDETWKV